MLRKAVGFLFFAIAGLCAAAGYTAGKIPDTINITPGEDVYLESLPLVTFSGRKSGALPASGGGERINCTAHFLGIFPIKEVAVTKNPDRYVNVSGKPFGIKMFCDGVIVVGFSDILTRTGYRNPARSAGLRAGDVITSVNGKAVQTNEEMARAVEKSRGAVKVEYSRNGENKSAFITPARDAGTGKLKSGMWVRDSGAGIGTMTFYDRDFRYFSGLGHGIKDADTRTQLPLLSGETVPVKITGIVKSKNGAAGQLKGSFTQVAPSGKVLSNGAYGVYGKNYRRQEQNLMPVANPARIKTGKAYILTTINGSVPAMYEIQIEKVSLTASDRNRNMVIRVTDKRLLALTGGIVRGMSGSPIIQDGALVGAVTHVFVNRVDKGYGIFARNMLRAMDRVRREDRAA